MSQFSIINIIAQDITHPLNQIKSNYNSYYIVNFIMDAVAHIA